MLETLADWADVVAVPLALSLFTWAELRLVKEKREQGRRDRRRQAEMVAAWLKVEVRELVNIEYEVSIMLRNSSSQPIYDAVVMVPLSRLREHDKHPSMIRGDVMLMHRTIVPPKEDVAFIRYSYELPRNQSQGGDEGTSGVLPVKFLDSANVYWARNAAGELNESDRQTHLSGRSLHDFVASRTDPEDGPWSA